MTTDASFSIVLDAPIAPISSAAYDQVRVQLVIDQRPIILSGQLVIDAVVSMVATPFRVINGAIDEAPESLVRRVAIGSVLNQAAADAEFAQAAAAMRGIIGTLVNRTLKA